MPGPVRQSNLVRQENIASSAVNGALSDHEGDLGSLLLAVKHAAEGRLDKAAQKLGNLGISPADFLQAQCQALAWAARIHVGS